MKTSIVVALHVLALGVGFGCGAPLAEEPGEESAPLGGVPWQKILDCDNGAAVIDADAGERRNLQFVIRDRGIIGYLNSKVRVSTSGIIVASGEIITNGWQDRGVFQPADFQGFKGRLPGVTTDVHREGDRVKFAIIGERGFGVRCSGGGDPCSGSDCTCPPGQTPISNVTKVELANWLFHCN